ncbi:MAG TPA: D-alanyl-D-alanine carboxypeptidase family protein [Thermoanaerobaculia bacterium]|nr:D-alanyl-D-alanine carboxypeptidase family protein [Thermoanaerobaculia bacterium]
MTRSGASALIACLAALPLLAQPNSTFQQGLLVEPTTWTVLYEQNADQPGPIASMTKMMTSLLVLELIEQGKLGWDDPVTTSARASRMGGSQVYLRHREVFPVRDMMTALIVHSANDVAMALAEHVGGGSEEPFIAMMNEKARELGLQQTRFHSPHGLPGEGKPDDVSSPRDLARLGRALMEHPEARRLARIQTLPFRDGKFILYNPNLLLQSYPHATGLKTGTHDRAGSCVTATAKKGEMELIGVFMGATGRPDLFREVERIFEEAFETWEIAEPVKKGTPAPNPLPVAGGRVPFVGAVAGADARVVVRQEEASALATALQATNPPAPVREGERVGWIIVSQGGRPIGRVPMLAIASVNRASWLQTFWDHVWPW